MENENLELDVKPAGNKDLWLFLITVDIVFLCIFGFFLYRHFSTGIFNAPSGPGETVAVAEEVTEPEEIVSVEAVSVAEMTAPAPQTAPEPEPVAVVTIPAEVPLVAVLEKETEPQPTRQETAPAEQKESIIVAGNPKSKYRKVTFRWFGEGKKVQIVSGFTMSKPQALKKKGDYWETTLSIAPGSYKFLYIIDGENRLDPYAPEKDGRSVVEIK